MLEHRTLYSFNDEYILSMMSKRMSANRSAAALNVVIFRLLIEIKIKNFLKIVLGN